MTYKYKQGVLGGTFDHLHVGHKKLLDTAFSLCKELTIGLSTEKIYKEKFLGALIDPYQTREKDLINYLKAKSYLHRAKIIPLLDIFGPTLKKNDLSTIFVSRTTLPNALLINKERQKKGLKTLKVITAPFVKDESNQTITSERIRLGEVDREGLVYINIFKNKKKLSLPSNLREKLRLPVGEIITDVTKIKQEIENMPLLVTVGDIVSKSLKDINYIPDIKIIDFKTRRSLLDEKALNNYKKTKKRMYKNEPGTISGKVVNVYKNAVKNYLKNHQKQTITIDGEEDLIALPAILLAPLRSFVFYGQYDLNAMIMVEVTEEKKKIIYQLLEQFE